MIVSPYLLRPIRSEEQARRDLEAQRQARPATEAPENDERE